MRVARRNLRVLGSPAAELGAVAIGEVVQLGGVVAPLPGDPGGALWRAEVIDDADGHWLSDEGRDFLLVAKAAPVLVLAEGGRLLNAEGLHVGDEVAVFGTVDEAPDAAGLSGVSARRSGAGAAVRADAPVARECDQALRSKSRWPPRLNWLRWMWRRHRR